MWVQRQCLGLTMPFLEWTYIGWRLVVVTWKELGPGFSNGWGCDVRVEFCCGGPECDSRIEETNE